MSRSSFYRSNRGWNIVWQMLVLTSFLCPFVWKPALFAQIQEKSVEFEAKQFNEYLNQLGLGQLAAQRQWQAMKTGETEIDRFRSAYQVALWMDREFEGRSSEAFLTELGWMESLQDPSESVAVPALMLQKYHFGQLSDQSLQQVFRSPEDNRDTIEQFAETARHCRSIEHELKGIEEKLRGENAALELAQVRELLNVTQSTIGWCYYYRWLLDEGQKSNEELLAAKSGLMNLLGISAPDLDSGATFRWYDGKDALQRRSLLALGLVLTALGEFTEANTCMATLQGESTDWLQSEFFFFQWITVVRSHLWTDAARLEESYFRDVPLQQSPVAGRLLNSMLQAITGLDPTGKDPTRKLSDDYLLDREPVRLQVRSLLNRMVAIGWVKAAADWETQTKVQTEGSLSYQVIRLQQTIDNLGISGQSPKQLAPLSAKLQELAGQKQPGIRRWALERLTDVLAAEANIDESDRGHLNSSKLLQETLEKRLDLAWRPEERQELAWRLAGLAEKVEGQAESAIDWYQETIEADPYSSLADMSQVKIKLLEARFDPSRRQEILQQALQNVNTKDFAQNSLLTELYQAWMVERDSQRKQQYAEKLQPLLDDLIGEAGNFSAKQISAVAMKFNLLEDHLRQQSRTGVGGAATAEDLQQLLDRFYQQIFGTESREHLIGNVIVRQLLIKALPYWDQADQHAKIVDVGSRMDLKLLSADQQFLVLNYVTRSQSELVAQGENIEVSSLVARLRDLMNLSEQAELEISDTIKWSVRARFLDLLMTSGSVNEAKQFASQFGVENRWHPAYFIAYGRVLSATDQAEEAEQVWQRVTKESLAGSAEWFEAQYYLLRGMAENDRAKGKLEFEKLIRLYPDIVEPWGNRIRQLAADENWN